MPKDVHNKLNELTILLNDFKEMRERYRELRRDYETFSDDYKVISTNKNNLSGIKLMSNYFGQSEQL